MTHYFFTRIACDARTICGPDAEVRSVSHINQIIRLWVKESSRFYSKQVGGPFRFKVVLRYSKKLYGHVMARYRFPDWCDTTELYPHQWIADNVVVNEHCAFTRVDADDSYTVDFMSFVQSRMAALSAKGEVRALILYKDIRQYNCDDGNITTIMRHKCPMFSSLLWPMGFPAVAHLACKDDYEKRHGPRHLLGLIGNHGKFHEYDHETPERCFALQRITGINAANRLGLMGREWPTFGYDELSSQEKLRFFP